MGSIDQAGPVLPRSMARREWLDAPPGIGATTVYRDRETGPSTFKSGTNNVLLSKNVKRRRREEQQLPFTAYEMLTGIMGKASAT